MRLGERVQVRGREATIIAFLGEDIEVKYDEGGREQVPANSASIILTDTRLKSMKCPYCKKWAQLVEKELAEGRSNVYECEKCGRFVYEKAPVMQFSEGITKRTHSAKWDRCVADVRASGSAESPEAVCTAQLGEESYE